ncbi:threonine synthase [Dactylosporangium matsuzakiense]|uniref:Threonine synthase n=1 Tax=Dactylosporangium matsuzakiense TaxID=53360 RepID=A0A9W6KLU4_9ACTN|nr:threonine synthase [Dactylosporangium matsuzakiense]UWZ43264.1 threonine synthase [Dactylosporangium matsuzakiense]GLL02631.1 threonine synthase [Dactylosporangium matsuzakiense]
MTSWRGLLDSGYRSRLPVSAATPTVSLHEGNTPLLHSPHLSALTGCDVWLKIEGANPTGSFKDRGMTVAVSRAAEAGAELVLCASTGNTSASAAAYAARAGLRSAALVPASGVARGKLAQAARYGAQIVAVPGSFDDCLRVARRLASAPGVALVNSVGNELRLAGQRTVAYEIVDALGSAPDIHCLPVGNGGNITATWEGYVAYGRGLPRIWGFRAASPQTEATAIRIQSPASWEPAVAARDASGGLIESVSDTAIFAAYRELGRHDGVFAEPASAAGVAGLLALHAAGRVAPGQRIVVTLTGNGLKDPDAASDYAVVDVDTLAGSLAG